jgi:hypothetical protein
MRRIEPKYAWERYPENIALQQYSRCLGRVVASLPRRLRRIMTKPLIQAATLSGIGLAGAHAELKPGESSRAEREEFLQLAFTSIEHSRKGLLLLKEARKGDAAGLTAALELLERVEAGLRARPLPD